MRIFLVLLVLTLMPTSTTTAQHTLQVSFTPESEKYAQAARE